MKNTQANSIQTLIRRQATANLLGFILLAFQLGCSTILIMYVLQELHNSVTTPAGTATTTNTVTTI